MRDFKLCTIALVLGVSQASYASEITELEQCMLREINTGDQNRTVAQIEALCLHQQNETAVEIDGLGVTSQHKGVLSERLARERIAAFNPFVITPHKMNYILPVYNTNSINRDAYESSEGFFDNLEDVEAMFQISMKIPLFENSLFVEGDGLFLGFTLQAWWQIYADNISKPFRETNYQPELFYLTPIGWHPFDGNTALAFGIEHQSNGRSQFLSRSWNRVYMQILFEKENFALSLRPWIRLSEDPKEFEFDPSGDDNPDIEDFMGNFELGFAYKWHNFEFNFQGRQNFSTHNGSAELGFTFPLFGRLRGYATVFSGYGDSMIDYNYSQTRFGLGIVLTDIL